MSGLRSDEGSSLILALIFLTLFTLTTTALLAFGDTSERAFRIGYQDHPGLLYAADGAVETAIQIERQAPPPDGSCAGVATAAVTQTQIIAPTQSNGVTLTASCTSPGIPDPDFTNNTAQATTTVIGASAADVAVTATSLPTAATIGDALTYTVGVANSGPGPATGVVATDTLPSGVSYASSSPGCTQSAGLVTCDVGTLAAGAQTAMSIGVTTTTTTGVLDDRADVTTSSADPDPSNNWASVTTTVAPVGGTDMAVEATGSPARVKPGDQVTYALSIANAGPVGATGVSLTDTVPAGVTVTSFSSSQGAPCTQLNDQVTCPLGSVATGGTASATVIATAGSPGTVTNTAQVVANEPDPNPANNTTSVVTNVLSGADLSIAVAGLPPTVDVGTPVTYVLTLADAGPETATGVSVTDTLGPGLTLLSTSTSQGSCSGVSGSVTCALGSVAVGQAPSVTISATAGVATSYPDTAQVAANEPDPNPGNNSAAARIARTGTADLSIVNTASRPTAAVGSPVTYTLTVTNLGPESVADPVASDQFSSPGVTFTASVGGRSCPVGGNQVLCHLGGLAQGATGTMLVVVTPTAVPSPSPALTNTATTVATQPFSFRYAACQVVGPGTGSGPALCPSIPGATTRLLLVADVQFQSEQGGAFRITITSWSFAV